MWLVTSIIAAIIVSCLWAVSPKKLKIGMLAIMLWGLSIMILIDHILGYEGGPFLEMETDGLVQNGVLLGVLMLVPVFVIWGIYVLVSIFNVEKKETAEPEV